MSVVDAGIRYLLSLKAVRERAHIVLSLAKHGRLNHFEFHPERLDAAAEYVIGIIKVSLYHTLLYSSIYTCTFINTN